MDLRTERKNTKRLKNFWGHSVELVEIDTYQAIMFCICGVCILTLWAIHN